MKTGDKVRIKKVLTGYQDEGRRECEKKQYIGKEYVITSAFSHSDGFPHHLSMGDHVDWSVAELELITNENKKMSIKDKFAVMFLKEPEKSFRKAGITNGDNVLTSEGQDIFLSFLLLKNGAEFKTEVVDELLKEDKDDK